MDAGGCFLNHADKTLTLSQLQPLHSEKQDTAPVVTAQSESTDNWNVAAIPRGDGEFQFSSEAHFGSSSLDGVASGFWSRLWDSLNISWVPKIHHHCVDGPYRTVTRDSRLLRRNGKGPAQPYVNVEGYPKHVALGLIKNTLKRWLADDPGFGVIIGGPGA